MTKLKRLLLYFIQFLKKKLEIFFGNWNSVIPIGFPFVKKLIYCDAFIPIVSLLVLFFFLTAILVFIVKLFKHLRNSNYDIRIRELFLVYLTFFGAAIAAGFVVQKDKLIWYFLYFLLKIFHTIVGNPKMAGNPIGTGLFCGFMTAAKLGYLFYLFLVPRFFFDNYEDSFFFEHHQKRVGAMTSFVTGQLLKFAWFYHRSLYEGLFQRNWILLLFVGFFVVQLVWTRLTIVRNWRFLYPNDKRKRVVRRVLLLQLEFMANFFLQLAPSDSYIEQRNSLVRRMVPGLVNTYLKDKGKKIFFVRSSFVGWVIGQIFFMILYMKLFEFLVIITIWVRNWVRKNFFES